MMMMMMMMTITALNIFGITECFQIKSKDGVIQLLQQSLRELPEQLKLKKKKEKSGKCKGLRGKVARLRNTLGTFQLNFGHEKCLRFPSPLLNSARPDRQPSKSENRSGFIAMWERTGTNKQRFDERDKSCEERAFYRYLTCLVFEYFKTSFMSAKKDFLASFLRETSG